MKISSHALITDLTQRTEAIILEAEALHQLSPGILNWKTDAESWSILECIEHLNRYGDFYLPEIDRRLSKAREAVPGAIFRSGVLGNYFAESMLPRQQLKKMNTFRSMNPAGSSLDRSTLVKFQQQQHRMIELLRQARRVDLTRTKTSISISKWVRLRLGDTLRVVVYHNQRHLVQAQEVLRQHQHQVAV